MQHFPKAIWWSMVKPNNCSETYHSISYSSYWLNHNKRKTSTLLGTNMTHHWFNMIQSCHILMISYTKSYRRVIPDLVWFERRILASDFCCWPAVRIFRHSNSCESLRAFKKYDIKRNFTDIYIYIYKYSNEYREKFPSSGLDTQETCPYWWHLRVKP